MRPQLTILMPVRDGARFLSQAIESVISDEFTDFELVAVDDGSVDETPEILRAWSDRDPRIVIVELGRPRGISAALNRGLSVARAEFIARHDADDLFVPARLRVQLDALSLYPDVVLVVGGYEAIDLLGRKRFSRSFVESPEVMSHLLSFSNPIAHDTVMFRRADVYAVGGYDESIMVPQDYDLWLRLSARGRILALPMMCARRRSHDGQITVVMASRRRAESLALSERALRATLGRVPAPAETDAVAAIWREEGRPCDFAAADRVFREALRRSSHAGDPAFRRRVETLTAERWIEAAARLVLSAHFAAAAACLRYACRWHPWRVTGGAILVARKVARAFRHRIRRLCSLRSV
jgi:hypothetical protein